MKKGKVFCSMEHIDSDLIEEAETYKGTKKKNTWVKWGAMAACLCLVVGFFIVPNFTNNAQDYAYTVTYNNVQYAICGPGETDILRECGLPTELSEELAGVSLGYLKESEKNNYFISENEVAGNAEFFEYAPKPNDNVYIVRIEDDYYAAIRKDSEGYHGVYE